MKFNKLRLLFATVVLAMTTNLLQAQTVYNVSMGSPSYPNEVYFSLTNGEVKTVARNNWDIAFFSNAFSAGIITNDGANVGLWAYPNAGIEGWDSFDTANMQTWPKLYNNTEDWEEGSFNAFSKGHPDYGWGVYSMTSHNVVGDSLYLIKPLDGVFRKLQIVKKISGENKFIIRYAHVDGSNEHTDTLNVAPYTDRLFMAYSFTNGIVDREPPKADWDLLFTRYYALVMNTPYPVNGVLINNNIEVAKAHPVGPDFTDWSDLEFSSEKNIIGHTWKDINMATFQWEMTDSLAYFIRKESGPMVKLVFTAFSGSSTGTTTFNLTTVSPAGLTENTLTGVTIYPNPVVGDLNVRFEQPLNNARLTLTDLSGRIVKQLFNVNTAEVSLDTYGIAAGTYILNIADLRQQGNFKLIVSK